MCSKSVYFCLVLVVFSFISWNCSQKPSEHNSHPRNVYLITATGLRPDHLSSYLYQPIQTPGLDYLAYDGIRFTRAFSTSTDSLPAHLSMLTGMYPMRNPILQTYEYFETFTNDTLPEAKNAVLLLRDKGYRTAAFAADPELRSFVLRSGWFDTTYAGDSIQPPWQPSAKSTLIRTLATEWVLAMKAHPHFLLLNFSEPAPPYIPPEPYNHHYANHPYDGEVAAIDEQIGQFIHTLKQTGLFQRSIVIFAAPYGENPDGLGRAGSLEDGNLKIPMMIAAPELLPRQQMYETAVSLADLYPTLFALLRISQFSKNDGTVLFEKNKDTQITHDSLYSGSLFPLHFGINPRWFIWNDGWELTSGAAALKREGGYSSRADSEQIRKKEEKLRNMLGRFNGNSDTDRSVETNIFLLLENAIVLAREHNFEEAFKQAGDPALPETPSVLSFRSALLASIGRLEDAKKTLQKTIQMKSQPELLLLAADLELRSGNIEQAAEVLSKYHGIISYDVYSMNSIVLRRQGKLEEAQEKIGLALRLNPRSAEAHRQRGLIFFEQGQHARAEFSLRKAIELQPDRLDVSIELAETLMKLGKREEAKRLGAAVLIQSATPEMRQRARLLLAE